MGDFSLAFGKISGIIYAYFADTLAAKGVRVAIRYDLSYSHACAAASSI